MRQPFDSPLTPEEMYWFGLLRADGSVDHETSRVRFTQKDRVAVEQFLLFFKQTSKVSYRDNLTTYGKADIYAASSSMSNGSIVRRMVELGLKGRVHSELYASRHFWRGLVDGDGGVYLKRGVIPSVHLCSGKGPEDIVAFSEWVGRLFDCPGPKPYFHKNNAWYAAVGGGKARLLGPHLYEDGYSAVHRKRDLAISFRSIQTTSKAELVGSP